jgi:hypothetical protein
MAAVPRATADFTLTSVSGTTASGSITSDSGQGGNSGPLRPGTPPPNHSPTGTRTC